MNDRPALTHVPLVVDLDGTLLRTDLLHESTLALLRAEPLHAALLPAWLLRGKAHLKQEIARRVELFCAFSDEQLAAFRAADLTAIAREGRPAGGEAAAP